MSLQIQKLARGLKRKFHFGLLPRIVDTLTTLGTWEASKKLKIANVERVLIDNTVIAHGVTHETCWVDTGKAQWGDIEISTGFTARIPVRADQANDEAARSISYLPGITSLVRRGHFKLVTSSELRDEQLTHPVGRYVGYGTFDFSLFRNIKFESIKDADYTIAMQAFSELPSVKERRTKRLQTKDDPLFQDLVKVLGPTNSQDAWHITTAERHQCYCFLTMDFRLIRNLRAQSKNKSIKSLRTRILSPEEFGSEFHIAPIPLRLFSYHDASFPVLHEENWPDSKRRGRQGSKHSP